MKKFKKIIIGIIVLILIVGIGYGITFYFSFFQGDAYVKNGIVQGTAINKELLASYKSNGYKPTLTFANEPVSKINNVDIIVLGKTVPKNIPILLKSQRYYLPINYICNQLEFKVTTTPSLSFTKGNTHINFESNSICTINGKKYIMRGNILDYDSEKFISISDIDYLFGMTAMFNSEDNTVSILHGNIDKALQPIHKLKDGKVAMLRFEDVSCGGPFASTENQAKFKAMGDYLYKHNIRFNIAWIPRYVNPPEHQDDNLLKDNSINNAGFVNMLDYLINSGGQIGLHGYTHQFGDTVTGAGTELSSSINNSVKATEKVVEDGINTASALNIPVHFFESPHYHADKMQKEVIGKFFQFHYEPYNYLEFIKLKTTKSGNMFIPTPLGYVKNRDPSGIIEKLKNPPANFFASLFYHPYLELEYVHLETKNNTFNFKENKDSILVKLVDAFDKYGYSTIHPTNFGN